MAEIHLEQLVKRFGSVEVVKELDLAIHDGEFLVLLGPSGCGKTTVLRMIAGLEQPTAGAIRIGSRVVNGVPPKDRDIAMVFQNYALYPHMTVFDNMAYGLRKRRIARPEIEQRIGHTSRWLEITRLMRRLPSMLSGGQRQRVAVGRAMVRQPQAYLMDEPLSNLDFRLRLQTREELAELHRRLHVTTVYVTHDQEEAMTLGHRIAIMKDGVMQQVGTPDEVYFRPRNLFVAGFLGNPTMNLFAACLLDENGVRYVVTDGFKVPLPPAVLSRLSAHAPEGGYQIGLRPEDMALVPDAETAERVVVAAEVNGQEHLGSHTLTVFYVGGRRYLVRTHKHLTATTGLALVFDPRDMHIFDPAGLNLGVS